MLDGIAQFGILMLLLLAGMETELALVRDVRRAAISASVGRHRAAVRVRLRARLCCCRTALLPDPGKRLITALFLGTALSISSVKIVATVVRDMGFLRRNVGQVILASAIVDDTIGWIIIAITFSLAGQGSFDWLAIAQERARHARSSSGSASRSGGARVSSSSSGPTIIFAARRR